ncbi:MAG: alpha-mannosidase, partial [Nocardioidaceae bacterium]
MHDDRRLVEQRLDRVLRDRIRPSRYAASEALAVEVWHAPGEPVPVQEAMNAAYQPCHVGDLWGRAWSTSWFRLHGEVPTGWAGRRVEVVLDLGFNDHNPGFQAEGLAYDAHGSPIKGIHPLNSHVPVADDARGGERVDLLVEAAANPTIPLPHPTQLGDRTTAPDIPLYQLRRADVAVLDEEVWQLGLDVEVLAGLMHELSEQEPRRHQILRALERMLDTLDLHDVSRTAAAARRELTDVLSSPAHASA